MNSKILETLGIENIDIGYVLIGFLIAIIVLFMLTIILLVKLGKLQNRYKKFMKGKDAKSLEQELIGLYEDNKFLKVNLEKNKKDIRDLYKRMESTFQKVGLVKYDAFKQMGGQLSFSLALLDENDNGFILNSVHSSEGCYSYTKEIKNGESKISLGNEEAKALAKAMEK